MTEGQLIVNAFRSLKAGERAALATIVSVEGSSYGRPGARMLITENGKTTGVLSAGCVDRDVCERAKKMISAGTPALVSYDTTTDEDIVHVLIEPGNERVACLMQLLEECAESESSGAIATVFQTEGDVGASIGTTALLFPDGTIDGESIAPSIFDDLAEVAITNRSTSKRYELNGGSVEVFLEVVQPRVRLVIFGAGFDVLPVINLAKNLGWHTSVVDTRASVSSIEHFQEADAVWLCRPEDVSTEIMVSERTAVVVMTDNDLHDQELLHQLMPLPLRYLGCFGSSPCAETPAEIALSIVSEIKAVLSEGPIHDWSLPAFPTLGAIAVDTPQAYEMRR